MARASLPASPEKPEAFTAQTYWDLTHLTENIMTDQEIKELPKVWIVGGDGALGDIGFQNLSKVILQNRPNVKGIMLDTQVYSNTGGQNSDSSNMLGGYDMNQFGRASQGKLTREKERRRNPDQRPRQPLHRPGLHGQLRQALQAASSTALSTAAPPSTSAYTTCQPEHGVADDKSAAPGQSSSRDSRGMPEFVYDPHRQRARTTSASS